MQDCSMLAGRRVGFISTRLAGTDGVSLETRKWVEVLEAGGIHCFFMAGELDWPDEVSHLVPECHFTHPDVQATHRDCFQSDVRHPDTTVEIERLKHVLKAALADFVRKFDLEVLVPENAVTIPFNLPLGLALTEFAMETGMPMICHHHDFFWERKRFLYNACWDYLRTAFPPHLNRVENVVLNSSQSHQLSLRAGISSTIIPNVMDFANPPPPPDSYTDDLRAQLGFKDGEKFVFQPTRVVQRKGIERAIELLHRLDIPTKLVISHASGDEGDEYFVRVREYADLLNVDIVFCADVLGGERGTLADGRKLYTLADIYSKADLVTYPSRVEGFGNAFLETLYFKRPIMVNNYATYSYDIRPKGFRTVEMNDYITEATIEEARGILEDEDLAREMVEHNYALARRFFSYEVLAQRLCTLLGTILGA